MYIEAAQIKRKHYLFTVEPFFRYMDIQGVAVLLAETLILLVLTLERWRVVNKTR
jgi:hypothetical protein